MNDRPRALLISPVVPDPAGGGAAQRAQQWLHLLAADHDVDVLVVHRRAVPSDTRALMAAGRLGIVRELTATASRGSYWRSAARAVAETLVGRRDFAFVGWGREWAFLTGAAREFLDASYANRRWERLVAFRLQLFDYADYFIQRGHVERDAVTMDFDDLESLTRRSIAQGLRRERRWTEAGLSRLDAAYAAKVERWVVRRIPRVTVAAPEDRSWIEARLSVAEAGVLPNRVSRLPPMLPAGEVHRILFLGTLAYFPNQEAVRFLTEEVLPALRREDARWTVVVAGFGLSFGLRRRLEGRPGVEVRGAVEDVGEAYRATGAVAAPLFSGGGTKLKVIEALAHGRPVVATAHAVRGLALRPTEDFWPAETGAEWVAAFQRLAAEPALRRRLAASGRTAIRAGYVYGTEAD